MRIPKRGSRDSRQIFLIFSLFLIFLLISLAYYIFDRVSYAEANKELRKVNCTRDVIMDIGIVGDSWVAGRKIDSMLSMELLDHGIHPKVYSSGYSGAKSKLVYKNVFQNSPGKSANIDLLNKGLDYCIVIVGVNDAMQRMGPKFYAHHELMIIKDLVKYNIKPVIVTLPEFGIIESDRNLSFFQRKRNEILGSFTNDGKLDNIKEYRKVLSDSLAKLDYNKLIVTVDFDSVIISYNLNKHLYANPPHLNNEGNLKLAKYIAKCLAKDWSE